MTVHMADIAGRHRAVAAEVERRVLEVLRSGWYVGGPVVQEAEALAARWLDRRAAVGVASGTDALVLALQAVGVAPGDEVIVPALSFFATAGAVCAAGARPVVVDVLEDATLDPDAARRALTDRTAAVVPVHLFGNLAATPELGVPVVDDAAQAIGAPRSTGALTALSTYPTKTWGAAGDGGFVVGDDPRLLEAVRRLGNHGVDGEPDVHHRVGHSVGRNSRLDAVQAAVLLGHATRLEARVARRQHLAQRYDAGLPAACRPLPRSADSPVQQYCVLVAHRDRVRSRLDALGVQCRVYYPRPLHHQPAIAQDAAAPVAEHLAARLLALPVHAELDEAAVDRVLAALHEACA